MLSQWSAVSDQLSRLGEASPRLSGVNRKILENACGDTGEILMA